MLLFFTSCCDSSLPLVVIFPVPDFFHQIHSPHSTQRVTQNIRLEAGERDYLIIYFSKFKVTKT